MKDEKLDQLLKNALSTNFEPDLELNTKIMQKIKESERMNIRKYKKFPAVAAACLVLLFGTATVYAAWNYLVPSEIATEYGDKQLAKAFESKDAVLMDESQTYGNYTVTLLGAVSGRALSGFCSYDHVKEEKTYIVTAISRTDKTPMPDTSDDGYGQESFFISPLIQGLNPVQYNIFTMNGGYFEIVRDGIMYRVIECDNIEIFADKKLYLCVSNTMAYQAEAYHYDEKTGEISVNSNYQGMNLLFGLPLNKDKADKTAAEHYLEKLQDSMKADTQQDTQSEEDTQEEALDLAREAVENSGANIAEVLDQWKLVYSNKVKPDEQGRIYHSYNAEDGSGEGFVTEDGIFEEGQTGYSNCPTIEGNDKYIRIVLYYRDDNGDVTVSVYTKEK